MRRERLRTRIRVCVFGLSLRDHALEAVLHFTLSYNYVIALSKTAHVKKNCIFYVLVLQKLRTLVHLRRSYNLVIRVVISMHNCGNTVITALSSYNSADRSSGARFGLNPRGTVGPGTRRACDLTGDPPGLGTWGLASWRRQR